VIAPRPRRAVKSAAWLLSLLPPHNYEHKTRPACRSVLAIGSKASKRRPDQMRILPRVVAPSNGHKQAKPSPRYGGYPLRSALAVNSRFYEIRQVRRCKNPTHRLTLKGSLALGQIGKAILVPAEATPVLNQVASVGSYVEARPVLQRSAAPGVRVIGGGYSPEIHSNGHMTSLSEAVKEIVRMVRPELNDAQLKAATKVTVADIEQDDLDESESGKAAAAGAISAAVKQASRPSRSSG
jgi:hypothetical protein